MHSIYSSIFELMQGGEPENLIWMLGYSLSVPLLYALLSFFFLFRSSSIIDMLKLDKGFDRDDIIIHMKEQSVLRIAVTVTALLILFFQVPELMLNLIKFTIENLGKPNWSRVIIGVFQITLALLMIGERDTIVVLLTKKSSLEENKSSDEI